MLYYNYNYRFSGDGQGCPVFIPLFWFGSGAVVVTGAVVGWVIIVGGVVTIPVSIIK